MDLGLNGARAVVFGSSAGMGRAVASSLAREGASVFVTGRDSQRIEDVVAEIGAVGGIAADLGSPNAAAGVVSSAVEALGGLDILVTNTGGGRPGGIMDMSDDDIQIGYDRMLRPQLAAMRAAVPHLRVSGDGRIVALTARSILEASPELALSSVFRSGVAAAARSLALELAPEIRVNVVVPGQVNSGALQRFEASLSELGHGTPEEIREKNLAAIPLGRFAEPDEVGDLVAYLVSSRARYITGTVVRIDGGLTIGF